MIATLILNLTAIAQVKQTATKWTVNYAIKNMAIKTTGKFTGLQANIVFDKNNLAGSHIEADVDVNTLDSDNSMRDDHLKAEEYFDAARYPKISMRSASFRQNGDKNFTGVFNITIKGKTKAVEVPFTYTEGSNVALFKGSFKINRQDFGIGGKSLVLANDATIDLVVETSK